MTVITTAVLCSIGVLFLFLQVSEIVGECRISYCALGCCSKCKDDYLLNYDTKSETWLCYDCPLACTKCNGTLNCVECADGYYGPQCEYTCDNCISQVCDKTTGECKFRCASGSYFKNSDSKCYSCLNYCKTCTNGYDCQECESGYFLDISQDYVNSCQPCSDRCSSCKSLHNCTACSTKFYWGPSCNYNCVNFVGTCDKNIGSAEGCYPGFYKYWIDQIGGFACEICPKSCTACRNASDCFSCYENRWGSICQYDCGGCRKQNCLKPQGCSYGGCKDGFFPYSLNGGYKCLACPVNCMSCQSLSNCLKCHAGSWGSNCEKDCDEKCNGKLCDKQNGYCSVECSSTQYYDSGNKICKDCFNECLSCTTLYECIGCKAGKWGRYCQDNCSSRCLFGICSQSDGHCQHGCIEGYLGSYCYETCNAACKNCSDKYSCVTCKSGLFKNIDDELCTCHTAECKSFNSDGRCNQCFPSFWYPYKNGCCPCDSNCKDSDCNVDGACKKCNDGYFGRTCDYLCKNKDSYCSACSGNNSDGFECIKCKGGWYPVQNKCERCSQHCTGYWRTKCNSINGSCNNKCEDGWRGTRCDIKCAVENCVECNVNDPYVCTACADGFYTEGSAKCVECPENCLMGQFCDKYNGSCLFGCNFGWSGEKCFEKCPTTCLNCTQVDKTDCSQCHPGFFGSHCQFNCSQTCKMLTNERICLKKDGECAFGCENGFWGQTCSKKCAMGCLNSVCNFTNAVCLHGCENSFYDKRCEIECSDHCLSPTIVQSVNRTCDEENGRCFFDCSEGWFGDNCDKQCSPYCNATECERNSGNCTYGCSSGYMGALCDKALPQDSAFADNSGEAIGAGAGVGAAVVIAGLIVLLGFILRRRRHFSKLDTRDGSVGRRQQDTTDSQGPVYSNIDEACVNQERTHNFGVSNLLHANAPVRMSDLSENEDQTGTAFTRKSSSRSSSVKEAEIEEDSVVDDEETDNGGEVESTYYNVVGKRVAVAKLAEYIQHKSEVDLFNDFCKLPTGLLKAHKEARKANNVAKNRYKAIYPYDENRVVLHGGDGDYMNASFIDGYNRSHEYIASSGPFKKNYETTPDFWRMIWQERCETIVMLTKPVENEQPKCEKYWPEAGENSSFGDIHISCLTEDLYADYAIRILAVTKGGESFNIHHVHFTAWPDKGIPHDVTSMVEFRQKVRSLHKEKRTPILVHCSAGIGRTGTFVVFDMVTNEGEDRGSVDVFGSVAILRYQRCNMVQTQEQYVYLHHAVLHALTFDCQSIPGDTFLQNYNKLIDRHGGQRKIDMQFQQLQSISMEITDKERAEITRNKALPEKNRQDADIPADENRVKLHENRKPSASEYINAVYISSLRKYRKFIAAMSPLPSTLVDFLRLVWQENCSYIVSLDDSSIQDKTIKVYWPADNQVVKHDKFKVKCKTSKKATHYVSKKISLSYHGPKGDETRDVSLFIFSNWPASSLVPNSSDSFVDLIRTVDKLNQTSASEHPILIHCRTGAERSCLYCAVSVLISKLETEHEVSVVNTLRQIKARRLKAISSIEEYEFCHQAVISYLKSSDNHSYFSLRNQVRNVQTVRV